MLQHESLHRHFPDLTPVTTWALHRRPSQAALLVAEGTAGLAAFAITAAGGPVWSSGTAAAAVVAGMLWRISGFGIAERMVGRGRRALERDRQIDWPPVTCPYPGGGTIGVTARGGRIVAALRITPSAPAVRILSGGPGCPDDDALSLEQLAGALNSPDTPADRIHVVVRGTRVALPPDWPVGARYRALLGPVSDWAAQEIVVLVEIATERCAGAIARHGGGRWAAARVGALAARRVSDILAGTGIHALPVSAESLAAEADRSFCSGTADLAAAALADGVLAPVLACHDGPATLLLTLRPACPTVSERGHVAACAAVTPSFNRSGSPQRDSPTRAPGISRDARVGLRPGWVAGHRSALSRVRLHTAGCGQIIGADDAGRPVTVRLHGPGVRSVAAAVGDHTAHDLVERAIATGASLLLVTGRPALWAPLVELTGAPDLLWIAGWRYPPTSAFSALGPSDYSVVVLDGPASGPCAPTVWRISPSAADPAADVTLFEQPSGLLTVRTGRSAAIVQQVTTPSL